MNNFRRLKLLAKTIKNEVNQPSPNISVIDLASDDIAELAIRLEETHAPTVLSVISPSSGLTVADGFRFGCGFYLAVSVGAILLGAVFFIITLILGIGSLGGIVGPIG